MTYKKSYKASQIRVQNCIAGKISSQHKKFILPVDESYKNIYGWENNKNIVAVRNYFAENNIKWWSCKYDPIGGADITRHMLSSQVSCLNHLFFIKHDAKAVLSLINGLKGVPVKFKNVLNIGCDKGWDNYIAFEVAASADYLHEKELKRGEFCTSLDAVIYALDENDERWIFPIEWKYTESYPREDLSMGEKGKVRLSRYCNIQEDNLIGNSCQLKPLADYKGSIYFQEPFYQLMRQTLLAERICCNKDDRYTPAKHFIHIHVCPSANKELLYGEYNDVTDKEGMETAWRSMLKDQSLYHLVDPKEFMQPIAETYPELYAYLNTRYWQQ